MSWFYSPGQAAYSLASSLVLDQSATSNVTPTAPRLSRPGSVTAFLTMRLSGQMFVALPGETTRSDASSGKLEGLDAALWLRRVSRANPSRPQEKCGPNWTKETAGRTPFVSLEKSDPDGCYWRTSPAYCQQEINVMDAYVAGLIDGEGSITISKSSGEQNPYYSIRVDIGMSIKGLPLLEGVKKQYGGVINQTRQESEKWASAHCWRIFGEEAASFLQKIKPYVSLKQDQINIALQVQEIISNLPLNPNYKNKKQWTQEAREECERFKQKMHTLNQKGPVQLVESRWVIPQQTLFGTSVEYSDSWPRAGILLGGTVYRLQPLAPLTKETGSGLWPTPTVPNGGRVVGESAVWTGERTAYSSATGQKMQVGLETMVRRWPTPTRDAAEERNTRYAQGGTSLSLAVKLWPTPTGADGSGGPGHSGREGGLNLRTAVSLWPTPTINGNNNRKGLSAKSGDGLATAVKSWATPCARDWRTPNQNGNHTDQLPNQVGGSLNPDWVELLMGWPKGWTSLEPLPLSEFEEWLRGFTGGASDRYGMQAWLNGTWEEGTPRTVTGMKNRQARLRAIGNGQVPIVVAVAWELLSK